MMRAVTFVAGVAAGYVLGTRAGREKYDQIVEGARNLSGQPSVVQAQSKIKDLVGAGTNAVNSKISSAKASHTGDGTMNGSSTTLRDFDESTSMS